MCESQLSSGGQLFAGSRYSVSVDDSIVTSAQECIVEAQGRGSALSARNFWFARGHRNSLFVFFDLDADRNFPGGFGLGRRHVF